MIKEWGTVVSWQDGTALVSCDVKISSCSCPSQINCFSRILSEFKPQTSCIISVLSEQPLVKGQRVELGITKKNLLSSAALIYLLPLVGLFLLTSLSQMLFDIDFITICGSALGGIGGFLLAHNFSDKLAKSESCRIIILRVSIPNDTMHT